MKNTVITFVFLFDREFLNFNCSWLIDPTLQPGSGPRESDLYVLVQQARKGVKDAAQEYEDTMSWTLRPSAFEAFQRTFGARAIEYRDWFYSKLYQFFAILLHDKVEVLGNGSLGDFGPPQTERPWEEGEILRGSGRSINPDDLEAAFSVGEHDWEEFIQLASIAGDGRLEQVGALILKRARQRAESKPVAGGKTWQWTDNESAIRSLWKVSKPAAHARKSARYWISISSPPHLICAAAVTQLGEQRGTIKNSGG